MCTIDTLSFIKYLSWSRLTCYKNRIHSYQLLVSLTMIDDSDYDNYSFGPSAYFSLAVITMFTLTFILYEMLRRKTLRLVREGYFFAEEFVNFRQKRWIPVPPTNVDASDPNNPRIINPALIHQDCYCCIQTINTLMAPSNSSKVCAFYDNQNIFITGGTGFLGKVLIEKLLRSTSVATIYILVRNKKNKDVQTRFVESLNVPLFDRLKKERPDYKKHVVAVLGDCTKKNLGLSVEEQEELAAKVNIVFHVAATVRFDENVKLAFEINVKGTQNMLNLCKKLRNLKSVVDVSTAYSNCHRDDIDEVVYDTPLHFTQVETMLKNLTLEEAQKLTPKLLNGWPNTYVFTKALAESMVKECCEDLPIAIFRPAIITSTYQEPMENWVDSIGGPGIVIAFSALGIARLFPCNIHCYGEFVPVDMVTAALVSIAWDVSNGPATETTFRGSVPVYNYVSSVDNPVKTYEFLEFCKIQYPHYPLRGAMWAPRLTLVSSLSSYGILKLWYHYLPALLMDLVSILCLKKPEMFTKVRKIDERFKMAHFFINKDWNYSNENVKALWAKMDEEDRKLFPFDIKQVNWLQHFRSYQKGLRLYLFKDPLNTLTSAKNRVQRFEVAHAVVLFIGYVIVGIILAKIFL